MVLLEKGVVCILLFSASLVSVVGAYGMSESLIINEISLLCLPSTLCCLRAGPAS